MTQHIFRQAALARLASPEQLDRPSQLVRTRGWIALAVLAATIVAASVWAFLAKAPVKVAAAGILFDQGQLMELVSVTPGRIVKLNLEPGRLVQAGEVIAELGRPEIELDLAKTHADLADARDRLEQLQKFHAENETRELQAEEARLVTAAQSQAHVTRRIDLLEEKIVSVTDLLKRKLLLRDRLIETELELSTARERLSQIEDERRLIALRRLERESKTRLALLDEQLKINEFDRRSKRLEAQLAEERSVRSSHAGKVAEIKVASGDVVAAGAKLATLVRAGSDEPGVTALMYVSPRDGRRIEKGMTAEIVPSTIRKEEFGFVAGVVEDVADVAATTEGMRSVLKNEQLVAKLSGEGAPIAVRVRLQGDPSTASGLSWSSSNGPAQRVASGTLLDGSVVVERVPLITLIAPGLDAFVFGRGK